MSSGRLQGFVNRSGRSGSPFNSDRKAAQALKFLPKSSSVSGVTKDLHVNNNQVEQKNFALNIQSVEHEESQPKYESPYRPLGLDSIVDSDFDHTRTDSIGVPEAITEFQSDAKSEGINYMLDRQLLESNFEQAHYETQRDVNFPVRLTGGSRPSKDVLHQFSTTSIVQKDIQPFRNARTGRFQSIEPNYQEIRNVPPNFKDKQKTFASRKQNQSEDSFCDSDNDDLDGDDKLLYEEAARNLTPNRQKNAHVDMNIYGPRGESHIENNGLSYFADYNDETLKNMTYAELEAQSWEEDPNKTSYTYPRELKHSGTSLETKINFYLTGTQKEKNGTGPGRKAAVAFYEQLTSKEWDEAGEIFISKFTELMHKLQEKRREKREKTQNFEAIVQGREKIVRGKAQIIERKLQDMRTGGENLLVGSPRA